jgi:phosphoribosylglycinamide formyltransferase-1
MARDPINLAVLISGSGTTLQNLIEHIADHRLAARIALVIASKPGLGGIDRAREAGLPVTVIERRTFPEVGTFSQKVFQAIDAARIDLVCLAGWLCLLDLSARYANRIINIHPALLPSFGGRGMYGQKVHQAVLDHGCKVSGCTVHFVDGAYDNGPIILQRTCSVEEEDTAAALAQRVFEEEKIAYPDAIRLFAEGCLHIDGRRVRITKPR